jgi:L-threonate 2-dehydrogenase
MPALKSIGLIGLGLMGEVYASRLIAAGFDVIGFDVDAARNERLRQIGGRVGSLTDVAGNGNPIVVAVFSTDQVEDVVERALLPAAAGKIVICTSTCDPDQLAALGARIKKQLRFLEAPVSGTSAQVRHGDGVGLIGGDAQVAEAAAPILDVLFPKRFHMGNRRWRPRQARPQSDPRA